MFQNSLEPKETTDWLTFILELIKTLAPIATLIIAIFNLKYTLWMFRYKDSKEDEERNRNRKIDWFKKLILDYNLTNFYEFFENLETELSNLKTENPSEKTKRSVESAILEQQINVRRRFIDTLIAVDEPLYDYVLEKVDELIDNINKAIFDEGIKLSHNPMFQDRVLKPISETRTDILKKMFEYKGEESNKLLKS